MSDLREALNDLRDQINALPEKPTAAQLGPLEATARGLLTQSKNTIYEAEARELLTSLARMSSGTSPDTSQVRGLLRRARIRIEIAGDDHDFDEAIDILAQALDIDPHNAELHELLLQAAQRSSQHAMKVQGLTERYGLELQSQQPAAPASKPRATEAPKAESKPAASPTDPNVEAMLAEVASTYYAGDYARTADLAGRVLAIDPNNAQASEYQQKSEDNLMRGIVPDHRIPFDARVAYNRANSLVRAGNYEEAERLYREARDVAESAGIRNWKDVEQALLEIQDLSLARQLLADGDRLLAADDWAGALKQYQGALGVLPNYPEAEDRINQVRKFQDQYDQASVRLSMISGSLTERSRDLIRLMNMLAGIRQALPNSPRVHQLVTETSTRIQDVKNQLTDQGQGALERVDAVSSVEEKFRLAQQAAELFAAAVDLDSSDAVASSGLRKAEQLSAEMNEGRQLMERAAALIAQNFDNEIAQARQMLTGLRFHAQDQRYQTLLGDLLLRHLERVEAAIDQRDVETAQRWLGICKDDPFRILGRRSDILRLENEIRGLQQRRIMRYGMIGVVVLVILGVVVLLNRNAINSIINPTDTPTTTATATATVTPTATYTDTPSATPTNTPTDTPTSTFTYTPTPLSPEEQTATINALATSTALTATQVAGITQTAQQRYDNQTATQDAFNLTITQDALNFNNTSTAVVLTQQASQTIVAQTQHYIATQNAYATQTATNIPPTPTHTPTLTLTPTPSPTEPQRLCVIANATGNNINVRRLPTLNSDAVGLFPRNALADVFEVRYGLDTPPVIWYLIQYDPEGEDEPFEGWVSSTVAREFTVCPSVASPTP
ncbi:MAG: hypothetical protein H6673_15005 [Anaerolineales bacterium]|nr:hypothetical protein [Anaerolineales bacterium]